MRGLSAPVLLVTLAAMPLLGACGSAPETVGTSGVDELVIPTPGPDSADFVKGIDNELLPLEPGSRWTYTLDRSVPGASSSSGRVVVTVLDESREVAGVPATVVLTEQRVAGTRPTTSEEWFAQDDRGNVWLLGEDLPGTRDDWSAGDSGAQAGLAMPAAPRRGDGWSLGRVGEVDVATTQVVELDADVATAYDDFAGALVNSETRDGQVEERFHVSGVGLVRTLGDDGTELDLADFSRG